MKTKSPKPKRSEPIELDGQIQILEITKNTFGWVAHAKCTTECPTEPCLQTSNPFVAMLSQKDFDLLHPGDKIRFIAVVTRPRKVKVTQEINGTMMEKIECDPRIQTPTDYDERGNPTIAKA